MGGVVVSTKFNGKKSKPFLEAGIWLAGLRGLTVG